jgi:hypothetical protein
MKISESRLKQIVKEETDKVLQEFEYTPGMGFAIATGIGASIQLLTYLLSYFFDKRDEAKRNKEFSHLDLELADKFLNTPEIIEIMKKFADPDDSGNQDIALKISSGEFREAQNIIQDSGKLSESDIKKLSDIVEKISKERMYARYSIGHKYPADRVEKLKI